MCFESFEEPYLFSEKITMSGNINVYLLKNGNSTGTIMLRLVNKQAILRRDFKLCSVRCKNPQGKYINIYIQLHIHRFVYTALAKGD